MSHHKKIPARSEKQIKQLQLLCGQKCRKFRGRKFILDDGSYFTFANSNKNSNAGFWSSDVESTSKSVKYTRKAKFEQSSKVWFGWRFHLAEFLHFSLLHLVSPSNKRMPDQRLFQFINKHHSDGNYVFWPSCHYAKLVVDRLREKNINFVEKKDNPACVQSNSFGLY